MPLNYLVASHKIRENHSFKQEVYRDMAFNEKIYNECEDNTTFSGNFQTELYFESICADIKNDFTFKKEYLEP